MKKNSYVYTDRFCNVLIEKVFPSEAEAKKAGFTEPAFYNGEESGDYGVLGKSLDMYHMEFAAYRK